MDSTGSYSCDLMSYIIEGHVSVTPDQYPTPSWAENIFEPQYTYRDSALILAELVNRIDQQPVGWFPPRYPHSAWKSPLRSTPAIPVSVIFGENAYGDVHQDTVTDDDLCGSIRQDTDDDAYSYIRQDIDDSSCGSSDSTPASSIHMHSPPTILPPPSKSPIRRTKVEKSSPELSPLQTLRKKQKKRVRQASGINTKVKAPKTKPLRDVQVALSSESPLSEMVQCRWGDCTVRLPVNYTNVKNWSTHIRGHCTGRPEMVRCQWDDCGYLINKSSMWKHMIVHEARFKLRCPLGCGVSTRGDMMKRHLGSCPFAQKAEGNKENRLQSDGDDHHGDSDYEE